MSTKGVPHGTCRCLPNDCVDIGGAGCSSIVAGGTGVCGAVAEPSGE